MPTREDILAAADRVIRECGVGRATTRLIAEAAGCSEGSLYNHFASKEELLGLALHHGVGARHEGPTQMLELAGTATVAGNLARIATSVIELCDRLVPMMPVVMADPASMRERAIALDQAGHGPRKVVDALAAYLRREQELGRVRGDAEVEGAAMCVIGACFQQTLIAHMLGLEQDIDALASRIVDAVMPALVPDDGALRKDGP